MIGLTGFAGYLGATAFALIGPALIFGPSLLLRRHRSTNRPEEVLIGKAGRREIGLGLDEVARLTSANARRCYWKMDHAAPVAQVA